MKDIFKYVISGLIAVLIFYTVTSLMESSKEKEQLLAETALIEKEIKNVSKLVVTEMKYAKVYTYESTKSYGWDFFSSQKSALLVSNATAQISYDLKKLKYEVDPESKTITLLYLPEPELIIDPNIYFYKMDNGLVNRFEGSDYNTIKRKIKSDLKKQIKKDNVMKNAQNRLLTELSNIYILSTSMGWKLVYNETDIHNTDDLGRILF
ncbi:hypothetical protein A9Q93_01240 [Nonlabens dokdonensis]|uniref:DUF4230 domain-containing protein n=1 Tax=Nonlabens dokdonensis TaxID=328515 RepID=A0A1Z8BF93_9FLAO|nr:DUF4230 domain-containing protein [Nonlabens dokdonensis]OUS21229.1 hypothetical protein A9Q93_01240 [Nonlabens dokdonensis]